MLSFDSNSISLILDGIDHTRQSDEDLDSLSALLNTRSTLTKLSVSLTNFNATGAAFLAQTLKINTSLTYLNLYNNWNEPDVTNANNIHLCLEALEENTTLVKLDFTHTHIQNEGMKSLSKMLLINTNLTFLDLHNNRFSDEGIKYISEVLKHNTTLSFLDLTNNKIRKEGERYLVKMLKVNSALTTLILHCVTPEEEEGIDLSDALIVNTTLTKLNLRGNSIKYTGIKALSKALESNYALKYLDLSYNPMMIQGVESLSTMLFKNTLLERLCIGSIALQDDGVDLLSKALQFNFTLTHLDLGFNQISELGVRSLANMLRVNTDLTTLNFDRDHVGATALQPIADALKINSTLTQLYCRNSVDYLEVECAWESLVEESHNLIEVSPTNQKITIIITSRKEAFNCFEGFLEGKLQNEINASTLYKCLLGLGGIRASINKKYKAQVSELAIMRFGFEKKPGINDIILSSVELPSEVLQIILEKIIAIEDKQSKANNNSYIIPS